MSDLRELYQEVILDHSKHPRNLGKAAGSNHYAEGYNPLCGDQLNLYLRVEDGVVRDASFEGKGCSISTASASMMTEAVKGRTLAEVDELFAAFHAMVTAGRDEAPGRAQPVLGKLAVFAGVSEFPVRVKCASLAWHTLKAALQGKEQPISTE